MRLRVYFAENTDCIFCFAQNAKVNFAFFIKQKNHDFRYGFPFAENDGPTIIADLLMFIGVLRTSKM